MSFLSGYKTYIISAFVVAIAVVHLLSGDISWQVFLASPDLLVLLGGLGLASTRAAIAKI